MKKLNWMSRQNQLRKNIQKIYMASKKQAKGLKNKTKILLNQKIIDPLKVVGRKVKYVFTKIINQTKEGVARVKKFVRQVYLVSIFICKKLFNFLLEYWQIVLCSALSIFFLAGVIWMIVLGKMQEIDAGMKYMIYPIYLVTAAIFGSSAKFLRDKKKIIVRRREIDSRWASDIEIQRKCKFVNIQEEIIEGAGIPLISDGTSTYLDDTESHTLIIGSTGSGKTRRIILPLIHFLRLHNESVIVTDPKGELYEETSGAFQRDGYKVVVLNFRDPLHSDAWNPLAIPYQYYIDGKIDKAMEMINDIALNIMYDRANDDPFWQQSSADYFMGLTLGLFEDALSDQINLNNINYMSLNGQDSFGSSFYLKEYFKLKGNFSNAYTCASGTINAASETRGSILSVFQQKMRIFTSQENLSKMLSFSNFKMSDIGNIKTIVYMIIQDEKSTYHPLAAAFIKQCYEVLIENATQNGGKLRIRTNFVLDEFGNLPPVVDMNSIVSAARSRNIRLTMAIQSFKQLVSVYNESDSDVIKNNCNNLVYLYGRDLQTLREISELCGQKEEQIDFNVFEQKPLISTSQLQHLKEGEAIIITKENYPYKAKLLDINQYNFTKYTPYNPNVMHHPNSEPFDIQNFVKEQKKAALFTMMSQQNTTSQQDSSKVGEESHDANAIETRINSITKISEFTSPTDKHISTNDSIKTVQNGQQSIKLLIAHLSMQAFDFYEEQNYTEAEKCFTKLYYLVDSNENSSWRINLAYMKRRGETSKLHIPITELLSNDSENAFELINLAICYIIGFEVKKNWLQAVRLIRKIEVANSSLYDAISWWSDEDNCGSKEQNLVLFLLKASGRLNDVTQIELTQRLHQVQTDGYDVPDSAIRDLKIGV